MKKTKSEYTSLIRGHAGQAREYNMRISERSRFFAVSISCQRSYLPKNEPVFGLRFQSATNLLHYRFPNTVKHTQFCDCGLALVESAHSRFASGIVSKTQRELHRCISVWETRTSTAFAHRNAFRPYRSPIRFGGASRRDAANRGLTPVSGAFCRLCRIRYSQQDWLPHKGASLAWVFLWHGCFDCYVH